MLFSIGEFLRTTPWWSHWFRVVSFTLSYHFRFQPPLQHLVLLCGDGGGWRLVIGGSLGIFGFSSFGRCKSNSSKYFFRMYLVSWGKDFRIGSSTLKEY